VEVPVRFDCLECDQPWWSPPATGCPRCGNEATARPDPAIWEVGRVPGTRIFVSAQLRDQARFDQLVASGIQAFVDVAGDMPYVWRPEAEAAEARGVVYTRIREVEDTNVDLPARAFATVTQALEAAEAREHDVLLFCAAGLKRAPHLLYGVLRRRGHDAESAWGLIRAARPLADPFPVYVEAAERWAA
jgi:hypothetical protein